MYLSLRWFDETLNVLFLFGFATKKVAWWEFKYVYFNGFAANAVSWWDFKCVHFVGLARKNVVWWDTKCVYRVGFATKDVAWWDFKRETWFDETLDVLILLDLEQTRWFVETRSPSSPSKCTRSIPKVYPNMVPSGVRAQMGLLALFIWICNKRGGLMRL